VEFDESREYILTHFQKRIDGRVNIIKDEHPVNWEPIMGLRACRRLFDLENENAPLQTPDQRSLPESGGYLCMCHLKHPENIYYASHNT
jgi:hypothetical protein